MMLLCYWCADDCCDIALLKGAIDWSAVLDISVIWCREIAELIRVMPIPRSLSWAARFFGIPGADAKLIGLNMEHLERIEEPFLIGRLQILPSAGFINSIPQMDFVRCFDRGSAIVGFGDCGLNGEWKNQVSLSFGLFRLEPCRVLSCALGLLRPS